MTRNQLIEYLHNPSLLDSQTLPALKEVLDAYPFFQAGRMLWMKNLHQTDNIHYNSELKLAAAYVSDRARLFHLINELQAPLVQFSEKSGEAVAEAGAGTTAGEQDENAPEAAPLFKAPAQSSNEFVYPAADLLDYEQGAYSASAYRLSSDDFVSPPGHDESHSFSGWLSILRQQKAVPVASSPKPTPENIPAPRSRKMELIDNFLNGGHDRERIAPDENARSTSSRLSASSLHESDDLMTETLANIFIRQKHYRKAADIFERLRLKYPEKSVYFARRIKEVEELMNT